MLIIPNISLGCGALEDFLKTEQELLDQIMFINVLWKSPQKQFTGETYRFTIILDTSASSTSKSSTLAESHPVPVNKVDRAFLRPAHGLPFQSSGSSNESNRRRAHVHARGGPSDLVPLLHHSHFKMKPLERKRQKKQKNKTNPRRVSHKMPLRPSKTQLSGVCRTAQMHLVQQPNKREY